MFEKFNETTRRAVFFSRYESSRVGQTIIGTEHLLLGLLRESDAITSELWRQVGVVPDEVRARYPTVNDRVSSSAELPLSDNAKTVLARALHESALRQDREVEPYHLVLAILRVPHCRAAALLAEHSLEYEVALEILRLLVSQVRKQEEIDESTPIVLRQSHYEMLDRLAQSVGLSEAPSANRKWLVLAVMDALAATGIARISFSSPQDLVTQLQMKLAVHWPESPGA